MSDDVSLVDSQMAQQGVTIASLLVDADSAGGTTATDVPTTMVEDQPIPARQDRFRRDRPERVTDERSVNTDDRLSVTGDLVLQFGSIDPRRLHCCLLA
jgi:hypothetical protein